MKVLVGPHPGLSDFPETQFDATSDAWDALFFGSEETVVAVGYSSHDAMLYLSRLLELNPGQRFTLCIGLARFEGMTKNQKEAALRLDSQLRHSGSGGVFVAHQVPFHGKVSVFRQGGVGCHSILGSSNLGALMPPKSTFESRSVEVDVAIDDPIVVQELDAFLEALVNRLAVPFGVIYKSIPTIAHPSGELDGRSDVIIAEARERRACYDEARGPEFEIPLKTEPKSNLNVFFGKGRENKQGNVRPRNWYEVELIVPKAITELPQYPHGEFLVCTDDGYMFACKTSGDFAKNFRSRDDLTVLGRWIKGRLEAEGCLSVGDPVTEEVLKAYGRRSIRLRRSSESRSFRDKTLPVWSLDFSIC